MKHLGLFAAGVLFGTAGLKILSSKEAKAVYAHTTAAVLRAKDCVMQTVTTIREGADDIRRGRARDHRRRFCRRRVTPEVRPEEPPRGSSGFLEVHSIL